MSGLAAAAMSYAIAAAGNTAGLIAALGAATVQLATNMKPVNVAHTTSQATNEGAYHAALADDAATLAAAVGAGATSQLAFAAAQSAAEAGWLTGMTSAFATYAGAMAAAEADEIIALAQALATADNTRATADVTRITAV